MLFHEKTLAQYCGRWNNVDKALSTLKAKLSLHQNSRKRMNCWFWLFCWLAPCVWFCARAMVTNSQVKKSLCTGPSKHNFKEVDCTSQYDHKSTQFKGEIITIPLLKQTKMVSVPDSSVELCSEAELSFSTTLISQSMLAANVDSCVTISR